MIYIVILKNEPNLIIVQFENFYFGSVYVNYPSIQYIHHQKKQHLFFIIINNNGFLILCIQY